MTRWLFFAAAGLLLLWTLALMLSEPSPDALVTDQRAPGVHATPYRGEP